MVGISGLTRQRIWTAALAGVASLGLAGTLAAVFLMLVTCMQLAALWTARRNRSQCEPSSRAANTVAAVSGKKTTESQEQEVFDHLTVVSLNVCLWPPGVRNSLASAQKEKRCTQHIPRFLAAYDVALVQEAFAWSFTGDRWRSLMYPQLQETHEWPPPDYDALCAHHIMTPGTWTLHNRQLRLLSYRFHDFEHDGFVAFELVRPVGYGHSVLSVPCRGGQELMLHVLNVHLLPEEGAFADAKPLRHSQEKELAHLVAAVEALPRTHAWLVGGDFNFDAIKHETLVSFFTNRLSAVVHPQPLHRFTPTCTTLNEKVPFATAWSLDESVDQFYSNLPILKSRVCTEDGHLSDHFPIACVLQLPSKG